MPQDRYEQMKRHIVYSGVARGKKGKELKKYVFGAMRKRGWKPKRERLKEEPITLGAAGLLVGGSIGGAYLANKASKKLRQRIIKKREQRVSNPSKKISESSILFRKDWIGRMARKKQARHKLFQNLYLSKLIRKASKNKKLPESY